MKTAQEIERYVKHILNLNAPPDGKFTESQIQSYWVSIARLYHQIHCETEAIRYLEEFLAIRQWDREANLLMGEICERSLRDYCRALDCYERALQEKPDPRGIEKHVARVCVQLCMLDAADSVNYALKGIQALKQSRPFSGNLYTSDALQLLQQLFSAIQTSKKELPIAVETELLSLVEHALTLEETKTNEKLVLTLIELLVKFQEFQSAWLYISDGRMIFIDSVVWNESVCTLIEKLENNLSAQESIDPADRLFFADSLARSALRCGTYNANDLSGILDRNQRQLDRFQLPATENAEKWSKLRLEYLSRHYLYLAMYELQQLRPREEEEHRQRALRALNYLTLTLSHMPVDLTDLIERLALNERLLVSSRLLLALLCCFRYEWLQDKKEPAFRSICLSDGYGDSTLFRLLHPKTLLLQDRTVYPLRLDGTINRLLDKWDEMDQAVIFNPWTLDKFLLAAGWRVLDGSVRQWLRKIFPSVPEYPSQDKSSAGHLHLKPVLALSDLEAFIIISLIDRHANCARETGATTLGQITLLSSSKPIIRSELMEFWRFAIYNYGSKSYVQRSRYMYTDYPAKSIGNALREVRGSVSFAGQAKYLYLLLASVYKDMLDNYGVDRSVEAIHYFHVVQKIDEDSESFSRQSPPTLSLFNSSTDYKSLLPADLDSSAIADAIEQVSNAVGTRYRQFVGCDHATGKTALSPSTATKIAVEPENVFIDKMDRLALSTPQSDRPYNQQENKAPSSSSNAVPHNRRSRQLAILKTLRSVSPDQSFYIDNIPAKQEIKAVPVIQATTATAASTVKPSYRSRTERLMDQLKQAKN